jgi:hypothetical protein
MKFGSHIQLNIIRSKFKKLNSLPIQLKHRIILILIASFFLLCSESQAQKYEYAQIMTSKDYRNGKYINLVYSFSSKFDSATYYQNQDFKNLLDSIEFFESMSWELMNIDNYSSGNILYVTANLRRKKAKTTDEGKK